MNPNNVKAYRTYALALYNQMEYYEAKQWLMKVIEISPDDASGYNDLGLVLYNQMDYEGAALNYQKAIELCPHLANPYINYGLLLYHQDDISGADTMCSKALDIINKNPPVKEKFIDEYKKELRQAEAELSWCSENDYDKSKAEHFMKKISGIKHLFEVLFSININ